ncbi:MAG TPA: hypothetical protein H9784_05250 [Candidatus Desulfovibrio intestinavium]|uniref:Uncharacterized protein n=1 Tax=Candidatus Desulfovibrio intestinavium TaxID=2838534 RepID=A0A9D2HNF5_9BACT|nr:hypothetical protein [Candidatus Desulfovibrio intestinavium]
MSADAVIPSPAPGQAPLPSPTAAGNHLCRTLLVDAGLAAQAVRRFGLDAQLQVLQEELAEAIVAISHLRRGRRGAREEVVEELGDVLVLIDQLRTEPFMAAEIDQSVAHKCSRLRALLEV